MAHEIAFKNGIAQYASTQKEWHFAETQHQILLPGASVEEWQKASGMDYTIKRGFVRYATERDQPADKMQKVEDKVVLFRSDTLAPLGVVSDGYIVLQPGEVIEMFREWAKAGAVTIESAGVLFGGKRYFATAKLSETLCLDGTRDKLALYALFSTSADGSLASEIRLVTVRVVCNNTLRMAMGEKGALYRATHRTTFKVEEAKAVVEAANAEFGAFMATARKLAAIKVEAKLAEEMTLALFRKGETDSDKVRESRGFAKVMGLFNGEAKGATLETARETAWGWLNACTEYADHHVRARSDENRTASAIWGPGDNMKQQALEIALAV